MYENNSKLLHKRICEMVSSLKRCFASVLQGAEHFLNYLSSARLDSADYFMKGMKYLDSLDQKLFNQDLDGFHLFGDTGF